MLCNEKKETKMTEPVDWTNISTIFVHFLCKDNYTSKFIKTMYANVKTLRMEKDAVTFGTYLQPYFYYSIFFFK